MNANIREYFESIELRLLENPTYQSYQILSDTILDNEGKIRFKAVLANNDVIEFFEYVIEENGQLLPKKYSFHWQNKKGELIKRWDNAPHFSDLANAPHHIHNAKQVVSNNVVPNCLEIMEHIEKSLNHQL